jgi:hypothetical protein
VQGQERLMGRAHPVLRVDALTVDPATGDNAPSHD